MRLFKRQPKVVTRVDEYDGEDELRLSPTQLGDEVTRSEARRIVDDWMSLFGTGPLPARSIEFHSRTPKMLVDSLAGQTQVESLELKWGDYDDLSFVSGMDRLTKLVLRGATNVDDVSPLADLAVLRHLEIEGFKRLSDPSPIGRIDGLMYLELGGNWMSPRNGHVPSLGFLRELVELEHLLLHTVVVDDRDYSPLLHLPSLRWVRVMAVRGMTPSVEELMKSLPWKE